MTKDSVFRVRYLALYLHPYQKTSNSPTEQANVMLFAVTSTTLLNSCSGSASLRLLHSSPQQHCSGVRSYSHTALWALFTMANHLDEYYYGDFDDRGKDFPDEFHAVVDHGMWPTVEKIVEYEGIRHPRMKFVYIGSYHFRDGDQQAFARSNGHSIELYQGSRGNDIVQPIRGLGENRVYYKAPYLYVSGSQEARSRTKSRMTSRARAESMVHFVFLMKNEISSIHNKDDQDLLAEFESICVNFTHIKEEEDRKAEENSKDPKPRDYRPGGGAAGAGGAGGGGRYGSDSVKPEIPVKKKLGSGFGSSVKSEPDSDDELSFSSRNTWLSAQSSRRQTSYSYGECPSDLYYFY